MAPSQRGQADGVLLRRRGDQLEAAILVRGGDALERRAFPTSLWPSDVLLAFGASFVADVDLAEWPPLSVILAVAPGAIDSALAQRLLDVETMGDRASFGARMESAPIVRADDALAVSEADIAAAPSMERRPTHVPHICDGGAAFEAYPAVHRCDVCGATDGRAIFCTRVDTHADVEAVCDACVADGKVEMGWRRDAFAAYALTHRGDERARSDLVDALVLASRRVPGVLDQSQRDELPVCCDRLTDFIGHPPTLAAAVRFMATALHIEGGTTPTDPALPIGGAEDVCCFLCSSCGKRLFTAQTT